jgi:hypothetical protein
MTLPGTSAPEASSYLALNTGSTLSIPNSVVQQMTAEVHWVVSWEWTWDANSSCYRGPDGICHPNSSRYRIQRFDVTDDANSVPVTQNGTNDPGTETAVQGQVYHVRSNATGNGSGSDWTNAYTSLPPNLVRGATYYVAAGNYPGYYFKDPDEGAKWITIKKATVKEHGSNVGWNDGYATGPAVWSPTLTFRGNYYIFDGVTGGGPGSWDSGHGFKMVSNEKVIFIMFSDKYGNEAARADVANIEIRHMEIAGKSPVEPGVGQAFNATASGARVSNITVSHCYVHSVGGANFYWINGTNLLVEFCYVTTNASSPDHHGYMTRFNNTKGATYRWNIISDITGTGWIGGYSGTNKNIEIYGNIFFNPPGVGRGYGNGVVYTLTNTDAGQAINWRIHNNSFVNLPNGNLIRLYQGAGGNNQAYNNLFYKIDGTPTFTNVHHDYSWFSEPSGTFGQPNAQAGSGDPFVDWVNSDFRLKSDTSPGATLSSPFDTDMTGVSGRTRGAIQF